MWIINHWELIFSAIAFLFSLDAERRLYVTTDWSITKTAGDGWIIRNEGWLAEHDIHVDSPHIQWVDYKGSETLKRHESATVIVTKGENSSGNSIFITSRRFLFHHTREIAL
jgi:hypothetical protein